MTSSVSLIVFQEIDHVILQKKEGKWKRAESFKIQQAFETLQFSAEIQDRTKKKGHTQSVESVSRYFSRVSSKGSLHLTKRRKGCCLLMMVMLPSSTRCSCPNLFWPLQPSFPSFMSPDRLHSLRPFQVSPMADIFSLRLDSNDKIRLVKPDDVCLPLLLLFL